MKHANSDSHKRTDRVRHSKQDALDNLDFELLLEGAERLDHSDDVLQTKFSILVMGRLGLRVSELVHLKREWINLRDRMIDIPRNEKCDMGRGDEPCGQCKQHARQRAEYNAGMDYEAALSMAWSAKTANAARRIPFDFDPRVEICVQRFYDRYEQGWPVTHSSVNRRLQWAKDAAEGLDGANVYPHALRATAASYHAAQGVDAISLKSIFGWSQLSTARCYVSTSPERAAAVLRDVHQR